MVHLAKSASRWEESTRGTDQWKRNSFHHKSFRQLWVEQLDFVIRIWVNHITPQSSYMYHAHFMLARTLHIMQNTKSAYIWSISHPLVDTTPPSVTCIDDIVQTVELGTTSVVVFFTEPSATDISGTALLQSRTNAPGDSFPVGTTTVSYVFVDNSGNQADPCTFTVTVATGQCNMHLPEN